MWVDAEQFSVVRTVELARAIKGERTPPMHLCTRRAEEHPHEYSHNSQISSTWRRKSFDRLIIDFTKYKYVWYRYE